ncbi:response regulator [Cytophagales bacterium LB-30]|uniref:Response regulator n=1 Tax=Shiella aurantiaca TaxID=3058365 RepID=A0ABT8F559_9BACT|nr:response regulator [Shiella aurantiaca]MDN4165404.1 response regulator [Shiella aurantiaca]
MKQYDKVMIVDDDEINNFICSKLIKEAALSNQVVSFTQAQKALEYLKGQLEMGHELPAVIFLDISMPIMDGWDFLKEYAQLNEQKTKNTRLFMLSSSVHEEDIRKAESFKQVEKYLTKPMTFNTILQIFK